MKYNIPTQKININEMKFEDVLTLQEQMENFITDKRNEFLTTLKERLELSVGGEYTLNEIIKASKQKRDVLFIIKDKIKFLNSQIEVRVKDNDTESLPAIRIGLEETTTIFNNIKNSGYWK